jgi:hypothetical protein
MRKDAGSVFTWLIWPILLLMAAALAIKFLLPGLPWWVRAIPLGLAAPLILLTLASTLDARRKPPSPPS